MDNSNTDIIHQVVTYYLSVYEKEFKEEHPKLKKGAMVANQGGTVLFCRR